MMSGYLIFLLNKEINAVHGWSESEGWFNDRIQNTATVSENIENSYLGYLSTFRIITEELKLFELCLKNIHFYV